MDTVATAENELELIPDRGWNWSEWSGKTPLAAAPADRGLVLDDAALAQLADELIGKPYVAHGFDGIPGIVVSAALAITGSTVRELTRLNGRSVVISTARGRFIANVVPSLVCATNPIPDPIARKSGSFRLRFTHQVQGLAGEQHLSATRSRVR